MRSIQKRTHPEQRCTRPKALHDPLPTPVSSTQAKEIEDAQRGLPEPDPLELLDLVDQGRKMQARRDSNVTMSNFGSQSSPDTVHSSAF